MAEFTEPTYERPKPDDPRFETCSDESFAIYICDHISKETKIPFEKLFHHELILKYIEAIHEKNSCYIPIDSMPLFIEAYINSYKTQNEVYELMTGIPISEETHRIRKNSAIAKYHRQCKNKCILDYERRIASMNLLNFVDC
jgi:hypothetical protein